jgi:hypothetical protein
LQVECRRPSTPEQKPHQNALICERAVELFKNDFNPHPNAHSGNGVTEDRENAKTFKKNKKMLKSYVDPKITAALRFSKHLEHVDVSINFMVDYFLILAV